MNDPLVKNHVNVDVVQFFIKIMENQRTTQCFMDAYWATNLQVFQDYLGENVWFVMHNGKNNGAIYLYDLYNFIELF